MLKNKKVLLIGASGDLGQAMVKIYLAHNAEVHATYLTNKESLQQFQNCDTFTKYSLDVCCEKSVEQLATILDQNQTIPDVLVYNAGIIADSPVLGLRDEDWQKVIDVNLLGAARTCRIMAPYMRRNRQGKIFLISSVAAEHGGRGQANYAASKAGLEALGRTLAVEMANRNVLVNMIAPGPIQSTMTQAVMEHASEQVLAEIALKRLGQAEEVAQLAAHLSTDKITWITGQTFKIDGGFKL
jgi:3-oxoacyl-[acyl-carrier protein] reductase